MKTFVIFFTFAFFLSCQDSSLQKGTTSLTLGDYPMAIEFYLAHLKKRPDSYAARLGLGKAYLQQYADENNKEAIWKKAIRQLEAARTLRAEPEINRILSDAYLERCQTYLDRKDSLSALDPLSQALDTDPENVGALTLAGVLAYQQGLEQKALTFFQQVLLLDSTASDIYFNLGTIYWNRKNYILAQDYWLSAMELDSTNTEILDWVFRVREILENQK